MRSSSVWPRWLLLAATLPLLVLGGSRGLAWVRPATGSTLLLLALMLAAGGAPSAHAQDLPTPQLLEELRKRLLEPPECRPSCATAGRLLLEVTPELLLATAREHLRRAAGDNAIERLDERVRRDMERA